MIRKTARETLTSISNGGSEMSGEKIPDGAWQEKLIAEARLRQNEREKGYRAQALKIYPSICARCGRETVGRNSAISQSIIRITTTRTTQQMGVTGNFCACTVMRMNIPEMTSRMHTKTPLCPLQVRKRHRLRGFDHLLGSTRSCGNVNGSKAQGIQIVPAESMSAMVPPEKRWCAIHCSGSIPRQSATASRQSVISSFQRHIYVFAENSTTGSTPAGVMLNSDELNIGN